MRKNEIMEEVAFTSFRFSSYKTNDTKKISKNIRLFVDTYSEYNELDIETMKYLEYFIVHKILSGLSFLLKNRYYKNSNLWIEDFEKYLNFLKLGRQAISHLKM